MATQAEHKFTTEELDALLERAVSAREQKEWEERVTKAGGALGNAAGIYIWQGERAIDPPNCTDLCRTPRLRAPHGSRQLKPGRGYWVHSGDHVPDARDVRWRKATAEETAALHPIDVGFQVIDLRLSCGAAENALAGPLRERARDRELMSDIEKRDAERGVEIEKAEARISEARARLDTFFEGWSLEAQRAAITLSDELEYERAKAKAGPYGVPEPRSLGEHELSGDFSPPKTEPREPEPARAAFAPGTNVVTTTNRSR
jgi:hypothetical protein